MMTRQSSQHCTSVHSTGVLRTSLTLYFDEQVWFSGLPAPSAFWRQPPSPAFEAAVAGDHQRKAMGFVAAAGRAQHAARFPQSSCAMPPPTPDPKSAYARSIRDAARALQYEHGVFLARMPRVYHSPHTTTPPAGSTPRTPRKPRPQPPYPAAHGRTRIARNTQISPLPISQPLQAHQGPVNRKQHTHQDKRSHRHIGHADLFYSPTSLRRFGVVMAPMAFSNWHKNRPTIKATTYLQNNN